MLPLMATSSRGDARYRRAVDPISSPEIVCWWCSVDVSRVPLLPIANRLSHGNKNNGRLLEKPITLERKGIFTIATFK